MPALEDDLRAALREMEPDVLFQIMVIENFHCTYCAYRSGLVAYVGEIVARIEQYFCPIKHTRLIVGTHSRYACFLGYAARSFSGRG